MYPPVDGTAYALTATEHGANVARSSTGASTVGQSIYLTPDNSTSFQSIHGWAAAPTGKRVVFDFYIGRNAAGSTASQPCVVGGAAVNR